MKKLLFSTIFLLFFSNTYAEENSGEYYSPKEILEQVNKFENDFFSAEQIEKRKKILQRLSKDSIKNRTDKKIDSEEYNFIFHTIKNTLGTDNFNNGLKCISNLDNETKVTWVKILNCFPTINSNSSYTEYFPENFLTKINISDEAYISENGKFYVSFKIKREKGNKYINIPYTIQYESTVEHGEIISSNNEEVFKIPVKPGAMTLYIDRYFTILRELHTKEMNPTIADLLNSESIIYISELDNFDLLEKFKNIKYRITPKDIIFKNIENEDLIIDGFDNKFSKLIIDKIPVSKNTSEYIALKNPFNENKNILIINNPKTENVNILDQYKSYQSLIFKGKDLISSQNGKSNDGILVYDKQADTVIKTKDSLSIKDIIMYTENNEVIFVGEHHNMFSHHINQLEIIKNIYELKPNLVIGLEMFQKKYQSVLNNYIAGRITEKELLQQTNYFDNWGYDFNLYAPIFKFAQNNKIPLVALNIDRNITKKIFEGNYDNITNDEWLELPKNINILNDEYRSNLEEFFKMHPSSNKKFNNFYLAQNIWDEIMAQNIIEYKDSNSNPTMVVLAGSGHLGKNSGIPLRYKRLTGKDTLVILQDEEVDAKDADFIIFTKDIKVLGSPKLGIYIYDDEKNKNKVRIKKIVKNSPAFNANLKVDDIILKCNGNNINNINDLKIVLSEKSFNSNLKCDVKRKNNVKEYIIRLENYSNNKDHIFEMIEDKNKTNANEINKVKVIEQKKK